MSVMRFGISARLGLAFLFMLVLMAVLTFVGIVQVNSLNANLTEINAVNAVKQHYAINFRGSVHDRAIAIRDVVISNYDGRQVAIARIEGLAADYASTGEALAGHIARVGASDTERGILARIAAIEAEANPLVATVIAEQQAGNMTVARVALAQAGALLEDWLAEINAYIDYQ